MDSCSTTTNTIIAAAAAAAAASPDSSDSEDGPYFDLEFALPDQETDTEEDPSAKSQENDEKALETENDDEAESGSENDDDDEEEEELKLAVSSNECTDQNVTLSPSDELFFKGDLVSIEPSSILLNNSEENSKLPVFLLKSATKFRVLLLKLKKSKPANGDNLDKAEKSDKDEANAQASACPRIEERENQGKVSGKLFAVKFKVEEVPLVSLFTRDSSSKENNGKGVKAKHDLEDSEEKKLTKEVVQKYLKMVKPFYIRVSKRYVEKLKFSGHLSFPGGGSKGGCTAAPEKGAEDSPPQSNLKTQIKQGRNLQAGLKVVRKHLGKSRSASAVAAAPPGKVASNRVDDSLVQLQDGIQGAILHCKRSLNVSRDMGESSSVLSRSVSDPSHEKSVIMPKVSSSSATSSRFGKAKETS